MKKKRIVLLIVLLFVLFVIVGYFGSHFLVSKRESVILPAATGDSAPKIIRDVMVGTTEWVLVPVVPFPTIKDEISWSDILVFWKEGDSRVLPTLFCTQEVMRILEALLGKPNTGTPIKIVSPEKIVDEAWAGRPNSWAIVPFDQLAPRWKGLRLDGVDVLEKGLAKKDYPLRIYFSIEE